VNVTICVALREEPDMKYLCTIYGDESQMASATPEQVNEMLEAYGAFGQEAGDAILGGEGLQPTSTATTVRVRDGERMLTDGPFAETKEQLGGFYLLECNSLDEAIELAAKIPGAQFGSVEVRPVMNYDSAGAEDAQQSAAAHN
jgi:hypothetical protein